MGKVNSHSTRKPWENTNVPKVWVSYRLRVKQEPIQFRKQGKSEFS